MIYNPKFYQLNHIISLKHCHFHIRIDVYFVLMVKFRFIFLNFLTFLKIIENAALCCLGREKKEHFSLEREPGAFPPQWGFFVGSETRTVGVVASGGFLCSLIFRRRLQEFEDVYLAHSSCVGKRWKVNGFELSQVRKKRRFLILFFELSFFHSLLLD